jgi:AraC-like DNA-binding protein
MTYAGRGRIVLWEGGSLWAFDTPRGATGRSGTGLHAHHAIQLTFSVGGSFSFRIAGAVVPGPAVVIAPDIPHAYDPDGRNAMIFIEPESRAGRAVLRDLGGRPVAKVDPAILPDAAARLSCIWQDPRPEPAALAATGQDMLARFAGSDTAPADIDGRIARVLRAIAADPAPMLAAPAAAGIACLSESRFSHLFAQEVGLAFRTYMLWRRLTVAVDRIAAGASLTAAAHDAGFADSAHFSRTFLRTFGIPASLLLLI